MSRKKRVYNLNTLDERIHLLRKKSFRLQREMDTNLQYMKSNTGSMFINSILGQAGVKQSLLTALFTALLRNEKVQGVLDRLAGKFADVTEKATEKVFMKEE